MGPRGASGTAGRRGAVGGRRAGTYKKRFVRRLEGSWSHLRISHASSEDLRTVNLGTTPATAPNLHKMWHEEAPLEEESYRAMPPAQSEKLRNLSCSSYRPSSCPGLDIQMRLLVWAPEPLPEAELLSAGSGSGIGIWSVSERMPRPSGAHDGPKDSVHRARPCKTHRLLPDPVGAPSPFTPVAVHGRW